MERAGLLYRQPHAVNTHLMETGDTLAFHTEESLSSVDAIMHKYFLSSALEILAAGFNAAGYHGNGQSWWF